MARRDHNITRSSSASQTMPSATGQPLGRTTRPLGRTLDLVIRRWTRRLTGPLAVFDRTFLQIGSSAIEPSHHSVVY